MVKFIYILFYFISAFFQFEKKVETCYVSAPQAVFSLANHPIPPLCEEITPAAITFNFVEQQHVFAFGELFAISFYDNGSYLIKDSQDINRCSFVSKLLFPYHHFL